jgi:hypothetical protein
MAEFDSSIAFYLVVGLPICAVPWVTLAKLKRPDVLIWITIGVAGAVDVVFAPWMSRVRIVNQGIWMQIGAITSAFVTTLVMRRCDFRLHKEPK